MSAINQLVKMEELDFSRVRRAADDGTRFKGDYDAVDDTLFVYFGERPAEVVVHYLDDFIGLLYDPASFEVVGIQVEAFEHSYVPNHDLSSKWEPNDSDRRLLKSTGDLIQASERKVRDVTKEVERITRESLIGRSGNRSLVLV